MFVNLNMSHAAQDFKVVITDNTGLAAHDLPRIKKLRYLEFIVKLMLTF